MTASALLVSRQGRLRAGWRAALFLVLLVALSLLSAYAIGSVVHALLPRGRDFDSSVLHYMGSMTQYLSLVAGALLAHWLMLRLIDRRGWSYVGLAARDAAPGRVIGSFALGGLAIGLPCVVLIAAHWLDVSRTTGGGFSGRETTYALGLLVPAAFAEELMMRGYLLSALADGLGRWGALASTSVVFALLHFSNPGMTPAALAVVALAGIFLGAVRYATSSLYAAWAAHLAWNAVLGVGLHALVSGTTIARTGWQTLDSGPDWATGGAWGPEGGAAAVLGLLAATSLLIIRRPRLAGTTDTNTA